MSKTKKLDDLPRFAEIARKSYTQALLQELPEYPELVWFGTKHMENHSLKVLVELVGSLAMAMIHNLDNNPETDRVIAKLVEAKDHAIRSFVLSNPKFSPLAFASKTFVEDAQETLEKIFGKGSVTLIPAPLALPAPKKKFQEV